jgi:hypothetical protein
MSQQGDWQSDPYYLTQTKATYLVGVGYDGTTITAFPINWSNGGVWYKTLTNSLGSTSNYVLIADSRFSDPNGLAVPQGDYTALFLPMYSPLHPRSVNVYYNVFEIEHSGKPKVIYAQGQYHNFLGKNYALVTWYLTGCQRVAVVGKGMRKQMSNRGWILKEMSRKKERIKVIGRNDNGRGKAKVVVRLPQ